MPCHTAWHPSDDDGHKVGFVQREGPILMCMIRDLSKKMGERSYLINHMDHIVETLMSPIKLTFVQIAGFDNHTTEHPRVVSRKVARLAEAGAAYGELYDTMVKEMCRLCQLSEKVPGKFLSDEMVTWWRMHKRSLGHEGG